MSTINNLAFTTLACPTWSVTQAIDAARRCGYDGIKLRLIDGDVIWYPEIAEPEVALPQHATLLRAWMREAGAR